MARAQTHRGRRQLPDPDSKRQQMKVAHRHGGPFIRSSPTKEGEIERAYFRSIGAVLFTGSCWQALGADGNVLGEHATRWQAWQQADKLGVERARDM